MNKLTAYQLKSQATKSRRTYSRPTKGQIAAYKKLMARGGRKHLSAEECAHLGEHPYLTESQRNEFVLMAIAKGW